MNRKALFLLSLLMMFINSAAFGIEYEVPEGNAAIKNLVTEFSEAIASYCYFFDLSEPVEVILDSQTLSSQLNRPLDLRPPIHYQYLLINDYYEIDTNIYIRHYATLCGLHDWIGDLNIRLTRNIRQALNEADGIAKSGSGSFNNCNIASIINNVVGEQSEQCQSYGRGKKTTLWFSDSGQDKPLLEIDPVLVLRHLKLRTKGTRRTREPILKVPACTIAFMSDVEMEDLGGVADSLLKVDDGSRLYAKNTTFNFRQRPDGSSKALCLYCTSTIRLDSDTINCYGSTGTVIYWDGIFGSYKSPSFLRNLQINVPRDDANMTGMYLLGKTGDFHFFPVELSNITLTGGLSTGFEFAGDFHLATTDDCGIANTNNHWQSTRQDAQRCVGSPARGVLLFADHVACVPEK